MNPFVKMLILLVEMETALNKPNFVTEKRTVMMAPMKMLVVSNILFLIITFMFNR